ncbi:Protein CBR-NHR-124 [Caenorhabditis briggsae]|uniref:Protein CBR-NHR-124 n=1 Tax=Caenorhabditis briggsae TaxID=6238 RepID=A8WJ82_CAEBR|nr:Protein CBR-NHR-124 [Caenorhabditis briggsae]CAP20524.1 Protein CBR-NHR-124 [Caenorhabditis briggsae]
MATNLDRPQTCAICHGKAYGYNYDVVSCNACKMFFRRANVEGIGENCKSGGGCYDGDDFKKDRPRCRACRYRKCIALGMQHKSTDSDASPSPGPDTHPRQQAKKSMIVAVVQKPLVTQAHIDSRLIQQMLVLHHTRREVYLTINICEDPSFLDLVLEGSNLSKYKRPQPIEWEKTERKLKPWGSLGVLLIVEIVKAMSFYEELLLSDRVILLKNVAFKSHHLSIAFDSFMAKKGRVLAPNGEEMFPDQLFQIAECYDIIMDLLTSPMQPLLELNLTENEYLLLNMIMICNPALSGLSPSGQEILSKEQQAYAKLLLQVCMMRDPREGPARYGKILAVIEKLERQKDVTHRVVHTLRRKWKPDFHFSGVLTEACRLDSDRLPYMKTEI